MDEPRARLSAFVIAYNRAELLGTCLRALSFADELVVIDKSSTDQTRTVAERVADRVITVPWSPTVEETRAFALAQCRHEWVLFLDDDECLSPEAVQFLRYEIEHPRADIYALPLRHYVLGVHDERAYYWPEHHVRCFRRGTVGFSRTVHAGIELRSDRVMRVAPDTGVCIHHLSHPDVASWIERTNRYTGRLDRARVVEEAGPDGGDEAGASVLDGRRDPAIQDADRAELPNDLVAFAHGRIDHWVGRTKDEDPSGYPAVVALLRAIYDMVDCLKSWEEARGADGSVLFRDLCGRLDEAYAEAWPARGNGGASGPYPAIQRLAAALWRRANARAGG